LRDLIESLGIKDQNPTVDGGLKLFGKPGKWPETLSDAHTRFLVRIETYIEESVKSQKNYILVTHADAVAAALKMFEHGNADVQDLDFCARLIAERNVALDAMAEDDMIYAQKWDIRTGAVKQEILEAEGGMAKYYEKQHLENVEEKAEAAATRRKARTKTDATFAQSLKTLAAGIPDEDDSDEEAEAEATPAPIESNTASKKASDKSNS